MSTFIVALLPLLLVFVVFFVIYRSVRGKKSGKLKSMGWLELLIAYLCVVAPIGLIMGMGKLSPLSDKVPGLNSLGTLDSLMHMVMIAASFYVGACLWKTSRAAVRKAKIILVALLVFNVLVVKGIYSLIIYAVLARADVSIPARAVFDALTRDTAASILTAAVVVSWYIYLNRSQRVREIYGTPSVTRPMPQETKTVAGAGTRSTKDDGRDA